MKKKIVPLMMGTLLLLTACGRTGSNSASAMLPVAAAQSAAVAIVPMEDKAQENTANLPTEDTEEVPARRRKHRPHPLERNSRTCRSSRLPLSRW